MCSGVLTLGGCWNCCSQDPPAAGPLLLPSSRNPDTLMDLRPCSLLLLWTLVVALTLLDQEVLAQHIYTNTWAVLVPAGPQEADRLARKHGFLNLGPVSLLLPSSHGTSVFCHGLARC